MPMIDAGDGCLLNVSVDGRERGPGLVGDGGDGEERRRGGRVDRFGRLDRRAGQGGEGGRGGLARRRGSGQRQGEEGEARRRPPAPAPPCRAKSAQSHAHVPRRVTRAEHAASAGHFRGTIVPEA